jgi:hypothetical protein
MLLKDGNMFLIKSPLETQSGEWACCGFPMTLTAAAPSDNSAGKKIGAFGYGPAYLVGMREEFELLSSDASGWTQATRQFRAITRARLDLRENTGFATLKLAAA